MPSSFKYWAVDVMMMDRRTAFSCAMHASQRLCAEKKPRARRWGSVLTVLVHGRPGSNNFMKLVRLRLNLRAVS